MSISALAPVLSSNNSQRTFNRRDLIPLRPDILWKIERGVVRTATWSEEGQQVALGYWGPLDVVGQPLSRVQPYRLECLTSVEVSLLPPDRWHQALDAILLQIQQSEELLNIFHQKQVHHRLLQLLIWLAQKFGRQIEQGQLIELRLTHKEIAEFLGTTRVTVTRSLSQFEQQGIIHRSNRHLILLQHSV